MAASRLFSMKPTIICLLGKPLAGKDTVARYLREQDTGIATISMGEILREVKAAGSDHRFWPLFKDAVSVADAGGIVPDEPIFRCVTKLITEQLDSGKETVVWVGGPRSSQQLSWLDQWTKACGYDEKFFYVDVPDDVVYERVELRASHMRADDGVVSYWLSEFERVTKPVADMLREQGRLHEINGTGGKEVVGARAAELLMLQPESTLPKAARK